MFTLTKEKKDGHKVDISGDADTFWFQDVLKEGSGTPKPVEIDADSVATLIYTGGTTGVPKGVQQTHYNLISNAMMLNVWGKTREAIDVMVAVMPFFHSYGLTVGMNTAIAQGMSIILIPNPRETVHVLGSIEKHEATYYPGVPTMFVAFNNHPDREKYDLSSLRAAFSAAAPLPREVQEQFEAITGGRMLEAYGLTERLKPARPSTVIPWTARGRIPSACLCTIPIYASSMWKRAAESYPWARRGRSSPAARRL